MSPLSHLAVRAGGTAAVLLLAAGAPAFADDTFQQCVDRAAEHGGEPPTCTQVDGGWVASWPGEGSGDNTGIIFLVVVVLLVGLGLLWWRVSLARRLATDSGMDAGLATQMTLLSDDGLDATYLASSLRQSSPPPAAAVPPTPAAAHRLAELKGLLDAELITQAEYDERRRAIIADV